MEEVTDEVAMEELVKEGTFLCFFFVPLGEVGTQLLLVSFESDFSICLETMWVNVRSVLLIIKIRHIISRMRRDKYMISLTNLTAIHH